MAKVNSARIAAIKANFEHGEVITEDNLADLIDAIAEAAEAHEHKSTGGDGSGTGDAGPIDHTDIVIDVYERITVSAADWHLADAAPSQTVFGIFPALGFSSDTDQQCFYSLFIPHRFKAGTTIQVQVDWAYSGNQDNGTVCWKLDYRLVRPRRRVDGTTTTISKVTAGNHTARRLVRTRLTKGITGARAGQVLALRLWRDVSEDTLATEARMIQVHFRIRVDKLGQTISSGLSPLSQLAAAKNRNKEA